MSNTQGSQTVTSILIYTTILRLQGIASPDSASRKSTMSIYSLLDPCPRASAPTMARATSPRMSSSNRTLLPLALNNPLPPPQQGVPTPILPSPRPPPRAPHSRPNNPPPPVRCYAHSARISLARYPSATRLDLTLCAPLRHLCFPHLCHHL